MEKEIFSKGKSIRAIAKTDIAAAGTTYGDWIDTTGYNSLTVGINVDWTAGAISVISFQESDDAGHADAATINDKYLLEYPTQLPIGADCDVRVATVSKKKYVRLLITTTGAPCTISVFGMAELNNAITQPINVYASTLATSSINAPSTEGDSTVTPPKR